MGSSRWGDYVRRPTVEEVERIDAAFARLPGVDAVYIEQIRGLRYRRFECVGCGRSVRYLYPAQTGDWLCANCCDLSYAVRQTAHAPTAFEKALPALAILRTCDRIEAKMDACPYRAARWRRLFCQYVATVDQLELAVRASRT